MTKKTTPAPTPAPEPHPMDIDVKIHSISTSGSTLAKASVTLGGCFAVRGIKVMNSEKGPFVSMPGYKSQSGFKDICFPCTPEFHKHFQQTVLNAYRQELTQLHEHRNYERPRQRESSSFEERAADLAARGKAQAPRSAPLQAPPRCRRRALPPDPRRRRTVRPSAA